jgi:hypothetical protein
VFFGSSDLKSDPALKRGVTRIIDYGPYYFERFFPLYDMAILELDQDIPTGFKPLALYRNVHELTIGQSVRLAGYGLNPEDGSFGRRRGIESKFSQYLDRAFYQSMIIFKGAPGKGVCNGDSGGPAYVKEDGRWYILGVASGFEKNLTPEVMGSSSADCTKNMSLYTYAHYYEGWIQEVLGDQSEQFTMPLEHRPEMERKTFEDWCASVNYDDDAWLTVKSILQNITDQTLDPHLKRRMFSDCQFASEQVNKLKVIHFSALRRLSDLSVLESLSGLEKIVIRDHELARLDFGPLANLENLQELDLSSNLLENLKPFDGLTLKLKSLDLSYNNLDSLLGVESFKDLEELRINNSVSNARAFSADQIEGLKKLKTLELSYVQFDRNIKKLTGSLSELTLKSVRGIEQNLIGKLTKLEVLRISEDHNIVSLDFIKDLTKLTELRITKGSLSDISIFKSMRFKNLSLISFFKNKLNSLFHLKDLTGIQRANLRSNPITNGQVIKTPSNCPSVMESLKIAKYCR